jgi:hypothetical protein
VKQDNRDNKENKDQQVCKATKACKGYKDQLGCAVLRESKEQEEIQVFKESRVFKVLWALKVSEEQLVCKEFKEFKVRKGCKGCKV